MGATLLPCNSDKRGVVVVVVVVVVVYIQTESESC